MADEWQRGPGLRIKLSRIPGITPKKYLQTSYQFQHPPLSEYSINYGATYNTFTAVDGTEYGRKGGRKLRTMSFDTIILDWESPWAMQQGAGQMDSLRDSLVKLSENLVPFELLVTHQYGNAGKVELHIDAVCPDLVITEREPDARYPNVTFYEWRDPVAKARASAKTWPQIHKLTHQDTLYSLARKYYGDKGAGKKGARAIAKENGIPNWGYGTRLVLSKKFTPGSKIRIPKLPTTLEEQHTPKAIKPKKKKTSGSGGGSSGVILIG
jgi:hypothetical protein